MYQVYEQNIFYKASGTLIIRGYLKPLVAFKSVIDSKYRDLISTDF